MKCLDKGNESTFKRTVLRHHKFCKSGWLSIIQILRRTARQARKAKGLRRTSPHGGENTQVYESPAWQLLAALGVSKRKSNKKLFLMICGLARSAFVKEKYILARQIDRLSDQNKEVSALSPDGLRGCSPSSLMPTRV